VRRWVLALAIVAALAGGVAGPARAEVSLQQVGTFDRPVYVTAPAGDTSRLFVVEQPGRIQVVRGGVASTFLDISARVKWGGEQGLLSMAFAPDYATSGLFYVYYSAPPPGGGTGSDVTISEFRALDADHADPASERVVLRIPHRRYENHNGGQLQFGPDGLLWIGTGDGGGSYDSLGNAQQTDPSWNDAAVGHDARLGKLLRIDPHAGGGCDGGCTIPAGNPGFRQPEIWAKGLRNPWRFSFDRATGDVTIGDVGQDTWEEVDFAPAPGRAGGADFGWSAYEGLHPRGSTAPAGPAPGVTFPVLEKGHAAPDSFTSIAGGYVVRDATLPDLVGRYLYADTYGGTIRAATLAPGGATSDTATSLHVSTLVSFGEDACGHVYAVSLDGPVYRLVQGSECILAPAVPLPGTGARAPGSQTSSDKTAPKVTVSAASRQRPWRTGVVRVRVSCDEACTLTARGTFQIVNPRARANVAWVTLRTAQVRTTLGAGATVTVKAKVSAATRRSLARALRRQRRVSVRFALAATDRAGNARRAAATSRITRR
jgi:glucose/arabinose dehydrogenase